jgi:hypothetical protein
MADPLCRARADPADGATGWLHDCAALSGDSGGPVFRNGSLNVVAMASATRAEAGGRRCRSARAEPAVEWLGGSAGCANVAVPVTDTMRAAIWDATMQLGLQAVLAKAGYDTGPRGHISSPQLQAAIAQARRDLGWRLTDKAMYHLLILYQTAR